MTRRILVFVSLLVVLVACSDEETQLSTTSSVVAGGTQPTGNDGSTTSIPSDPSGSTSTTLRGAPVTSYRTVHTENTVNGPVIHVVIPGDTGYTDVDLEIFLRDLVAANPTLWGAEVFDDEDAAEAFLVESAQRTDEQNALLNAHHLVTLTEGNVIIWRGPFSNLGQSVIGS